MQVAMGRQTGAALLTALWLLVLLLLLATSTVALVAADTRSARQAVEAVQARLIREGAVNRTIQLLADSQPARRPAIAERSMALALFDETFTLDVSDDSGRIDLNAASDDLLALLFAAADPTQRETRGRVARIRDWQDTDSGRRSNGAEAADYRALGLAFTPANRPFESVAELKQVLGISSELGSCISEAATVYSGGADVNFSQASPTVQRVLAWGERSQRAGPPRSARAVPATADESSLAGRVLRLAIRQPNAVMYDSIVLRVTGDDHVPALVMHWSTELSGSRLDRCSGALAGAP